MISENDLLNSVLGRHLIVIQLQSKSPLIHTYSPAKQINKSKHSQRKSNEHSFRLKKGNIN